jgi:hypothetical protein
MKVFFTALLFAGLLFGTTFKASSQTASSSNFGINWINGTPRVLTTSFVTAPPTNTVNDTVVVDLINGQSNISDSFGNLILTTDGGRIYNSSFNIITDGDSLISNEYIAVYGGAMSLEQSTIILPMPDSQYYMFCTTFSDSQFYNLYYNAYDSLNNLNTQYVPLDLLYAHKIDMRQSANNGQGLVVKRKDTLIYSPVLQYTQMTAVKHGNGRDWWLVKQAHDTNLIFTFLVTPDSIYGPYEQGFSEPHWGLFHLRGQSAFSKDGSRYATTSLFGYKAFVADFDRCSGVFSNPMVYNVPCGSQYDPPDSNGVECETTSLALSPNGQMLYVGRYFSVWQLDLNDPDTATQWYTAAWPDAGLNFFDGYLSLELGPDDKLYIGNYGGLHNQMSFISNPNVKGIGCGFCGACLVFPPILIGTTYQNSGVTTPPNMPHYELGTMFPCDTLPQGPLSTSSIISGQQHRIRIYPNPADNSCRVGYELKIGEIGIVQISDLTGRIHQTKSLSTSEKEVSIDLSSLPPGLYLVRYLINGATQNTGRIAVIH